MMNKILVFTAFNDSRIDQWVQFVSAATSIMKFSSTFHLRSWQHWGLLSRFMTQFSSLQLSHSVMSDSMWPHGLQHTRLLCPSPTPEVYSNSCPLSWWCHPTISSSVIPFSSCLHLSQHHGLFKWVSSLHQVAKVLEFQLQHQSCQWIFRTDFL